MTTKIIVLGHSFVDRLDNFLRKEGTSHLALYPRGSVDVRIAGFPGARLCTRASDFDAEIKSFQPAVVILQVGGNDIGCRKVRPRPETVGSFIHEYAMHVRNDFDCVQSVTVCSVLKRFGRGPQRTLRFGLRQTVYEQRRLILNQYLRVVIAAEDNLHFCHLSSLDKSLIARSFIGRDGVHLNKSGMKRYFREVRGAAVRAIRSLH